ncbi:MAG TPA: ParB/RepB/Spo0J family partition protein [Nitrososphaera sp.]|jgi:ParB family chromosome partitioning protein|nr:ParB/RepB/Spo0J family partition protein [Nitrososphaera sp.]
MEFVDSSIVEQIEMKMIRPSQFSIRDKFQRNDCDFETLVNSIREHGLLQPILIRPLEHGFEIVAGHRRFQACRTLRWRFITAKIRELSDKQTYEIQLTENIQRKSMDPIEEAEAFRRYVIDFGWGGVGELAKKIGKSEEYVSHRMQLLKLPDEIKHKIVNSSLKVSQAIEIVQVPYDKQQKIATEIINNNLTVRQIRELKMTLKEEERFNKIIISTKDESRSSAIAKKASLTLKITLARLDNLINEVHTTIEPEQRAEIINLLMELRLGVHSLIDESIRFKNKKSNS